LDDVRNDVAKLLNASSTETPAKPTPDTPTISKELYRVRKSWTNAASQKGAFTSLANAKKCCDQAGLGYFVYNSKGVVVYPEETTITPPAVEPSAPAELKVGDIIKLKSGSTYSTGRSIPSWVFTKTLYVREIRNDEVVFSTLRTGAITGVVKKSSIEGLDATPSKDASSTFKSYLVRITADVLNVRSDAGTNFKVTTQVRKNEVYTIVGEKNGWGKLKSGAGWISLEYTKKV
jgi:hypothetical protein